MIATEDNLSTLLIALRLLQEHRQHAETIAENYDHQLPDNDAIDQLCEELNCHLLEGSPAAPPRLPRIAIAVEGGCVQDVTCTGCTGATMQPEYWVVDYDSCEDPGENDDDKTWAEACQWVNEPGVAPESPAPDLDDICPTTSKPHEIDPGSFALQWDGGECYLDVNCKDCGRSGCVSSLDCLTKSVSW